MKENVMSEKSIYQRICAARCFERDASTGLRDTLGKIITDTEQALMTDDEVLVALVDHELEEAPRCFKSYGVQWDATTSFEGRVAIANDMIRGDNEGTPWGEYCKKTEEQS
jgi:hypothetical protein